MELSVVEWEVTVYGIVAVVFDAVVLAAGRSIRMGSEKALLPAPPPGGLLMWERQWEVLHDAGARRVYLSARTEQTWAQAARGKPGFAGLLHDALPGCGPLVGITAALERTGGAHVAALAVDLPRISVAWFLALVDKSTSGVGAVGRRRGFFEPLAAIYPREMMWLAWEAIAAGDYSLQRVIARGAAQGLMRVLEIDDMQDDLFENWNAQRPPPEDAA